MTTNYGNELRLLMCGLYTEKELDQIRKATIAIAGVGGGNGSYILALLCRKGFEHFTLSDPERYEPRNISRQLFANNTTLGKLKLDIAIEHMLRINPNIQYATVPKIELDTIEDFIQSATVVSYQAENFSPWILTHYICSKYSIPFVNVSRKDNLRTTMNLKIVDYRKTGNVFKIEEINFNSFGIDKTTSHKIIKMFHSEKLDNKLLEAADNIHIQFKKQKRFKNLSIAYPEVGDISNKFPNDYYKRYTDPENCYVAAALACRAITDLVIGRTTRINGINELNIFSDYQIS